MRPSGPRIDRLIVEARARITWGDAPAQVREWLISEKVYDFDADEIVHDLTVDRAASMRKRGLLNVIVGTAAIALAVAVGFGPWLLELAGMRIPDGRAYGWFFGASGLCAIYGAKNLIDGIERLLRGARAEGADTDVSEP